MLVQDLCESELYPLSLVLDVIARAILSHLRLFCRCLILISRWLFLHLVLHALNTPSCDPLACSHSPDCVVQACHVEYSHLVV